MESHDGERTQIVPGTNRRGYPVRAGDQRLREGSSGAEGIREERTSPARAHYELDEWRPSVCLYCAGRQHANRPRVGNDAQGLVQNLQSLRGNDGQEESARLRQCLAKIPGTNVKVGAQISQQTMTTNGYFGPG